MCGIVGFVDKRGNEDVLSKMIETLHHRGPDDSGLSLYNYDEQVIGLGHARLSVIDLSSAGHQPMRYGDLEIVFNGEVYNYKEIRNELQIKGHTFRTNSDTEVILHSYTEWGKECVKRFVGIFAFVVYDRNEQKLHCCRDRAGAKPFYYYLKNDVFLFSSELKAFHQTSSFEKAINYGALGQYFDYGYVPTPNCIFQHTFKLKQGHWLTYDVKNNDQYVEPFWSVHDYYQKPKLKIDYNEAKSEVEKILSSAFKYRMMADVPVGIFLSGGYDSSAVTAFLQKDRKEKLKTFTIGFDEGNDEAPFAKATADYLGTDHTTYYCTAKEAQEIIPELPHYYDEPFADSSAIPTILVSREARKQVTVALSADSGDEVFVGYDRYQTLLSHTAALGILPKGLKMILKAITSKVHDVLPSSKDVLAHKLQSVSMALNKDKKQETVDLYRYMLSLPQSFHGKLFKNPLPKELSGYNLKGDAYSNALDAVLASDYVMYLQDDILTKVDRATMSVSLEGREPLLDHRLIEFVAQLPLEYKCVGNTTKKILKEIVHQYLPAEMMNRPKAGFSLPIYNWLRQDLSYLLDEYFDESLLKKQGIFNIKEVKKIISAFNHNKLHYQPLVWKLLMFQMWYVKWM